MKTQHQKGFSLVEVAVVVATIGLLITGTFYGLRVAENAKIKAFIGQVTVYKSAAEIFMSQYKTWPGDYARASGATGRLNGCNPLNGEDVQCANGNGDHIVASSAGGTGCRIPVYNENNVDQPFPCLPAAGASIANGNETIQFWRHLQHAGLINGLRMRPDRYGWGDSMPKVKLAGGLQVIYGDAVSSSFVTGYTPGLTGHFFLLGRNPRLFNRNFWAAGDGVLDVAAAAALDREMDDGRPNTGKFRSMGGWGCGRPAEAGIPALNVYDGASGNRQCTILFKFDP